MKVHRIVKAPSLNALGKALVAWNPKVLVFVSNKGLRFKCPRIWSLRYTDTPGIDVIGGSTLDPEDTNRQMRYFQAHIERTTGAGTLQLTDAPYGRTRK